MVALEPEADGSGHGGDRVVPGLRRQDAGHPDQQSQVRAGEPLFTLSQARTRLHA
jgi:hypothetical protein